MKIKILSYNIHKGFDWNNKNYFLHEIKSFIQSTSADLVFLQEVVGRNEIYKNAGLVDEQFEYIADELWPHFSYAKNAIYDHGHHGNLILSKFPIIEYDNLNISTNPWEKRGLLTCKIKIPKMNSKDNDLDHFLYASCSHLNLFHNGRILQCKKIIHYLQNKMNKDHNKIPLILAGDFNDWNQKSNEFFESELNLFDSYKSLHGKFAKTFPSLYPLLCLDRIYLKNVSLLSSETLSPNNISNHLSDHLPLLCEVNIHET